MLEVLCAVAWFFVGLPLCCYVLHKILMLFPIYKNFTKKVTEDCNND